MQSSSPALGALQDPAVHRLDAHAQVAVPLQPFGIGLQANVKSCTQKPLLTCRPGEQTPPSGKKTAPPWVPLPTQTEPPPHAGLQLLEAIIPSGPPSTAIPPAPV